MYNICIIDDAFNAPCIEIDADNKLPVCNYVFKKALASKSWTDSELKSLIYAFMQNSDFSLKAFSNPEFFFNETDYLPDIVIYDWDYGTGAKSSESYLLDILKNKFCCIFIYTGCDQREQIRAIIDGVDFNKYRNRIDYFEKETGTINTIENKIHDLINTNFSFKFGKSLRGETAKSLEQILISLGRIPLKDLIQLLGEEKENETILSPDCLVELIVEKLRNELTAQHFGENQKGAPSSGTPPVSFDVAAMFWSYRLYYTPSDSIVRRGDIIFESADIANKYLVLSADCSLRRLWNSQFGFLNIVPIIEVAKSQKLIDKLSFSRKLKNIDFKFSSFTNKCNAGLPEGVFLLPFIKEDGYKNYLLFSSELSSKEIKPDSTKVATGDGREKKNAAIMLEYSENNPYKRLCTIAEPFLSSIISKILESISGIGVPDYSRAVADELAASCKKIFLE